MSSYFHYRDNNPISRLFANVRAFKIPTHQTPDDLDPANMIVQKRKHRARNSPVHVRDSGPKPKLSLHIPKPSSRKPKLVGRFEMDYSLSPGLDTGIVNTGSFPDTPAQNIPKRQVLDRACLQTSGDAGFIDYLNWYKEHPGKTWYDMKPEDQRRLSKEENWEDAQEEVSKDPKDTASTPRSPRYPPSSPKQGMAMSADQSPSNPSFLCQVGRAVCETLQLFRFTR